MGFNEISANEKPYFRNFSFFSFSSEANKIGNIGVKIWLVMPRSGHSLNTVLYFRIDYREYFVCM